MNGTLENTIMTSDQIQQAIADLAETILPSISNPTQWCVVGIRRGGAVIAQQLRDHLSQALKVDLPIGFLDITFYRDDLSTIGPHPTVGSTDLGMLDVEHAQVILVDDVLYSGRTVRAGMDALFEFGRPDMVKLAVLVDRGHRQLPVQPDFCAKQMPTDLRDNLKMITHEDQSLTLVHTRASS
ncbi:bifunctional pyr operon transcriptional regulator/uracil phosphoribosyltransferase PyrR [Magnetococcus sp. PR-3]|uniref:bifunctional pyr operon transcriptional regulator/uracil phosphoribosyltransferase PyrR n=1 Tax=Magnetococcus sp. PR-3 TaxID=3120355 RepID=UPI002FCE090C